MASIKTYETWNVTVPVILFVLLFLVLIIPMIVEVCVFKKLPRIFVVMLRLSLSDIEEGDDVTCVKVDGHKIKKAAVKVLSLLVIPLTIVTIFFSFWNIWLVEEETTGTCLSHFDCFPVQDGRVLQDMPVESCSQSFSLVTLSNTNDSEISSNEISYKCYRFVFRYAEGVGAAGGILIFTTIFSKIYFCLLVAVITPKRCEYLCLLALIILWIFAAVLLVLFIVVTLAVPMIREAVLQTDNDIIQFVLYSINFAAVVVGGYVVSVGVILPRMKSVNNSEHQSNAT